VVGVVFSDVCGASLAFTYFPLTAAWLCALTLIVLTLIACKEIITRALGARAHRGGTGCRPSGRRNRGTAPKALTSTTGRDQKDGFQWRQDCRRHRKAVQYQSRHRLAAVDAGKPQRTTCFKEDRPCQNSVQRFTPDNLQSDTLGAAISASISMQDNRN